MEQRTPPPYRVLAFDLDGTLTNSEKKVTRRTKEAIDRARERGCEIVLSSGRPVEGIWPVVKTLEMDRLGGYVVALNGAVILDCRTGRRLYEKGIPRDLLPGICEYGRSHGLPMLTYVPGGEITNRPDHPGVLREAYNNGMTPTYVEDFEASLPDPVEDIMYIDEPEVVAKACRELNALYGDRLNIYPSEPCFLEILPHGTNKALGLEKVLELLGCGREQLMAFGDEVNDLEMLRFAGFGVCMGNGAGEAKEAADYVTASNEEDGVALALEKFIL